MDIEETCHRLAQETHIGQSEKNPAMRFHAARRILITAGTEALRIEYADGLSLGDILRRAASAPRTTELRDFSVILLRAIAINGLLPSTSERGDIDRNICTIAEKALPEILERFKYPREKLTYEKRHALEGLHASILELLNPLRMPGDDIAGVINNRTRISRCMADNSVETYFGISVITNMRTSVLRVLEALSELRSTHDSGFHENLRKAEHSALQLSTLVENSRGEAGDAVKQFAESVKQILGDLASKTAPLLVSEIAPARTEPRLAAKRYQLHQEGRELRVLVPFINKGPGWAYDVKFQACADTDTIFVDEQFLEIGDVRPGELSISLQVLVCSPSASASILLDVSWRIAGNPEREKRTFSIGLEAQSANVNWSDLEDRDPYRITVAEGSNFVGRAALVRSISSRFNKDTMECVLIDGQKRVGKSSLALAVRDAVVDQSNGLIHVIYREFGDYGSEDPSDTIAALGITISEEMARLLPAESPAPSLNFKGTLAPLSQLARSLQSLSEKDRFLIILDEFDEIHPELYQHGRLADVFFQNLRTFSGQKNIGMILVGGERLRYILSRQGDQLNRFSRERLSHFSRSSEWDDYMALVQLPSRPDINWDLACVSQLYELTNGHPYYTKLICRQVYRHAVAARDTEVTQTEIDAAVSTLIGSLDLNHFAHFWMDGILAEPEMAISIELDRRRLLIAVARTRRAGLDITLESIVQYKDPLLESAKIKSLLDEFVTRDIFSEDNGRYHIKLPLFDKWLVESGLTKLIPEQTAQEQAALAKRREDEAFVTSSEIMAVTNKWQSYRGQVVGPEQVRSWLNQVPSILDQRILFKLLQNIRFVSERELREKLSLAHSTVKKLTTPFTPASRAERRYDLVVTYVDGEGKSGQYYASKYAEENLISTSCVIGQTDFATRVSALEKERGQAISGIVIVDDIVATGQSLIGNLRNFLVSNSFISERNIPVIIVVLLSTTSGEQKLRDSILADAKSNIDLRVCEHITDCMQALNSDNWDSAEELERARTLIRSLGSRIYKTNPIGFGNIGLLVVFPHTAPNNSLPILHSHAKSGGNWVPLFPRPTN